MKIESRANPPAKVRRTRKNRVGVRKNRVGAVPEKQGQSKKKQGRSSHGRVERLRMEEEMRS